ncbi:MAG: ABC transporter permease, partial [Promethearchaeota archaeon]
MSGKSSSTTPLVGQTGSGWYVVSYVGGSVRKHKMRTLSLLLGVVIGVALVASVFVWTDTGTRVAIDDYFEDNIFQFSVQPIHTNPPSISAIQTWARAQYLTESSYIVHSTYGFLGIGDMNDSAPYMPASAPYPYSYDIKDAEVLFVSNDLLAVIEKKSNVTGSFSVEPDQCLVSERLIEDAYDILNITIGLGDTIDFALAQSYSVNPYPATLGEINRLNLTGIEVVGIYSIEPEDKVLYNAFSGRQRRNYPSSGEERVFGWNDGIIMSRDQPEVDLEVFTSSVMQPKLLIRADPEEALTAGIENVPQLLLNYKLLMEVDFLNNVAVGGERQIVYLAQYIQAYQSRRTMGVLVAPVIVLSVFLTTFATNIFLSGRRAEVAILRARGASFRQLYAAFILEFIVIGIIGLVLGTMLSLLIGCLIPASTGFLQFDLSIFFRFLAVVRLQPLTWLISFIACLIPPLVFSMIYVRSFLRTEIYQALTGITPVGESDIGVTVMYLIGCIVFLVLFIFLIFLLPSSPSVAVVQFVYAVIIWVFLCDSGSRVVRRGIAGISRLLRPLFGEKTSIFVKSMRTRRTRIVPLLLILTFTFSITVFSVVEAQTVQDNAYRQLEYFIGADLRIESGPVPINRSLEIAAVPGVEDVMPVIRTYSVLGTYSINLIGINVDQYASIGNWDPSSMIGEGYDIVLERLKTQSNGIIFPSTLAERLQRGVGGEVAIDLYIGSDIYTRGFKIVGLGHSAPGLGYFDFADPSRPIDQTDGAGGFSFQEGAVFGLINMQYLQNLNVSETSLFFASQQDGADTEVIMDNIRSIGFATRIYSPFTFSVEEA